MRLGGDGLQPAAELPVRARRLLTPFRGEPGGPVGWLSSRHAVRWPDSAGRPRGTAGTIREVTPVSDSFALAVEARGRRRTFAIDAWNTPPDASPAALGDATTGRLFPPQYRPAGLVGRSVRVTESTGGVTLWL